MRDLWSTLWLLFCMIYFSQILKTKVKDSSDAVIGRLKDILIQPKPGEYTPLLFLLVIGKKRQEMYIPFDYVANVSSSEITLEKLITNIPRSIPKGGFVFLEQDLLDEQIVDVEGARVVRVNDLKLGTFKSSMSLLAIDVSFKGILRRLGLGWLVGDLLSSKLIDWRKAQRVEGALQLDMISNDLTKLHPADLANIIEDLSTKHGEHLVKSLDAGTAALVLEELEPRLQKILVNRLGAENATAILSKMSVDEVTDLVQMLPTKEAEKVMATLKADKLDSVESLLRYEDDSAGGLMTTDFVKGYPEWTITRTMDEIKKYSSLHSILYVYIVDHDNVFQGAVSLRRLLTAETTQSLEDLLNKINPISTLKADYSMRDIVRVMTKYNLFTAAVLDQNNHLIGVVTIDDVMRCLHPEA